MSARRFPFADYPKGWFHVAYSRDVVEGSVASLHYFGRRLICYRGESGTAYVLDAYCPHLGADIAVGGTVREDCVVCPFHGWKFSGQGVNVEIPYTKAPNRIAKLRPWPTVERAGMIFVWHSPEAGEPEWELPKIPEAEDTAFTFYAPQEARWKFRSHPQEVFENTVDIAHFATVHGVSAFGKLDVEHDGHLFRAVAEVNFETPIDPETGEQTRMGMGFARDFCKHIEQDIPIWEAKIDRDKPALPRGESAITEFRNWAERSYAESDPTPA
jgi:phenylpropionate dioxygenase-like ring-hydroxylating dioxygenase large terminal subunit